MMLLSYGNRYALLAHHAIDVVAHCPDVCKHVCHLEVANPEWILDAIAVPVVAVKDSGVFTSHSNHQVQVTLGHMYLAMVGANLDLQRAIDYTERLVAVDGLLCEVGYNLG
jgi:hypothetical protein